MPFFHMTEIYLHYAGTIYTLKIKTETYRPNKTLDNVKKQITKVFSKTCTEYKILYKFVTYIEFFILQKPL